MLFQIKIFIDISNNLRWKNHETFEKRINERSRLNQARSVSLFIWQLKLQRPL